MLRDLIYFDFDKAASILSQIDDGLLKQIQDSLETMQDRRGSGRISAAFINADMAGGVSEKTSTLESRVLHHDLLKRVEEELTKLDILLNINMLVSEEYSSIDDIHGRISEKIYVAAEGFAVIEDYQRMRSIADRFNKVANFINECIKESLRHNDEYSGLIDRFNEEKIRLDEMKKMRGNERNLAQIRQLELLVKQSQGAIDEVIMSAARVSGVPEFLIDGIGLIVDTFMANRIDFRLYPFTSWPEFQMIANLKRSCFVDGDIQNFLFAYGMRPNIKLTVLGSITSLPKKDRAVFDPMQEFNIHGGDNNEWREFEKSLRGIFIGFDGMEQLMRPVQYPRVAIYPIAIYKRM